jgi:hypothetical protein
MPHVIYLFPAARHHRGRSTRRITIERAAVLHGVYGIPHESVNLRRRSGICGRVPPACRESPARTSVLRRSPRPQVVCPSAHNWI